VCHVFVVCASCVRRVSVVRESCVCVLPHALRTSASSCVCVSWVYAVCVSCVSCVYRVCIVCVYRVCVVRVCDTSYTSYLCMCVCERAHVALL